MVFFMATTSVDLLDCFNPIVVYQKNDTVFFSKSIFSVLKSLLLE